MLPIQNAQRRSGAITVNAGFGMNIDSGNGFSVVFGPLAAGKFDFSKFGHGGDLSIQVDR